MKKKFNNRNRENISVVIVIKYVVMLLMKYESHRITCKINIALGLCTRVDIAKRISPIHLHTLAHTHQCGNVWVNLLFEAQNCITHLLIGLIFCNLYFTCQLLTESRNQMKLHQTLGQLNNFGKYFPSSFRKQETIWLSLI